MAYRNFPEICNTLQARIFSERPIPPIVRLYKFTYPGGTVFDHHSNGFSSACLILKGRMTFQERGFPEIACPAGTLALAPIGSVYRWRIEDETETFQCLHNSFSAYEHGELAILFGMWQRHVGSVALKNDRIEAFMRELDEIQERKALEIRYSIATLGFLADAVESLGPLKKHEIVRESPPIAKCAYFIEKNLSKEIGIERLSREAGVSPSRLFQLFQAQFGESPLQYVARRKADEAKRLLTSTELSIGEIAERLGFNSANYFIRFFKKHAGRTPNELRKKEALRILGRV